MEECYKFTDNYSWLIASGIYHGSIKDDEVISMLNLYQNNDPENDLELDGLLIIACWKGSKAIIVKLLTLGANKDARSLLGSTPIMFLAQRDWLEMVEYFVKIGADMTIRTNNGDDCSYFAKSRTGNYKVIKYLNTFDVSLRSVRSAHKEIKTKQNSELLDENKRLKDQNEKLWKILNKMKTKKGN